MEDGQEVEALLGPGDFVLWREGVFHWWEALEDLTIATMRWPLKPAT
jgi:hypothetical protein